MVFVLGQGVGAEGGRPDAKGSPVPSLAHYQRVATKRRPLDPLKAYPPRRVKLQKRTIHLTKRNLA